MKTVSVIGYGQIGSALAQGLADLEGWQLGKVLTRKSVGGLAQNTTDPAAFLTHPADLIIETAGPGALRDHGPRALAIAPVWSVGAVAMADPSFRKQIASAAQASGHDLRLFACGMANMPLHAQRLKMTMRGPEIKEAWSGPLTQAITRWPNRLNTAVATALNGPGLEATELSMEGSAPGTPLEIEVDAEGNGVNWHRTVRFEMRPDAPYPVAQMLLGELARFGRSWQGV